MTNEQYEHDHKNRQISMMEAAEIYGFSHSYLSRMAKNGRLKAVRIGRSWVTTPANVEEYIRSRKRMGGYRQDIQLNDD